MQLHKNMRESDLNRTDHKILTFMITGKGEEPWGYATPSYIAEALDKSPQYVQNRLQILRAGGLVRTEHKGLYRLTDDGIEMAEDRF